MRAVRVNPEFPGVVVEVHSGDSLSIKNLQNNNVARYFLANLRAPMCQRKEDPGKPWGFEAKEFLRKLLIGFYNYLLYCTFIYYIISFLAIILIVTFLLYL